MSGHRYLGWGLAIKGLNVRFNTGALRMNVAPKVDFHHQGLVSQSVILTHIIKPL